MQTSLLHNLVVGTPIISATYDKLQTPVNRYLLDPAIQCHYSTTTSKQSRVYSVANKLGRKTGSLSQGVQEHGLMNISETVKRKLSLGARILQVGGVEKVFKQFFSVREGERLLKVSTTSGPLAGLLFISTDKVAFCSERSMKVFTQKGHMLRIYYTVAIPLKKIKCVNHQSKNVQKPKQKYIGIVTEDNFDFWFMGIMKYQKTMKYLEQAVSHA
ncbi:GEM-like protein 4 isoform B [Glycine soja]|uniref:GEM-like protein 4 isoform B n=1 Tax=Glycine soja TaxID=3848 RepID=A0A445IU53_GLYSO|nr:GEM-like protein 4 isoform B [Glycine soja]